MKWRGFILALAAFSLGACDLLFPKDKRAGDEAVDICIGRVRAQMTYEAYQQLENAQGRFVPSYLYDITLLDLEAIQELIATGADDTAGTRLTRQNNDPSAAVESFKLMRVDEKGALFLGRRPALYKVRGKAQPGSTVLESGCARQLTNMRLVDVSWTRSASAAIPASPPRPAAPEPAAPVLGPAALGPEIDATRVPNLGGVR